MNEINTETSVLDCRPLRAYYTLMSTAILKRFLTVYMQLNAQYARSVAENEQRIRIINEILNDR